MRVDENGFNILERALRRVTGRHFSTAWTLLRYPKSGPLYLWTKVASRWICPRFGHDDSTADIVPICRRCHEWLP